MLRQKSSSMKSPASNSEIPASANFSISTVNGGEGEGLCELSSDSEEEKISIYTGVLVSIQRGSPYPYLSWCLYKGAREPR